ncbi:hypothetical protein HDV02_006318, partial [Globomyces sp. JEL0801]
MLDIVLLPPASIAEISLVPQGPGLDDKPLKHPQISFNPKWLSGKGKTSSYKRFGQHQNHRTPIKTRSFTKNLFNVPGKKSSASTLVVGISTAEGVGISTAGGVGMSTAGGV